MYVCVDATMCTDIVCVHAHVYVHVCMRVCVCVCV